MWIGDNRASETGDRWDDEQPVAFENVTEAQRVRMQSFVEYQGMIDFRGYVRVSGRGRRRH
ncbi:MAG: hypothetical protein GY856_45740 [bacterium]|nr:hypothetical protein [bacterium]